MAGAWGLWGGVGHRGERVMTSLAAVLTMADEERSYLK